MTVAIALETLKEFFDANPSRYKANAYNWLVQADGYLPSAALDYQLCTPWQTMPNPVTSAPKVPAPFTAQQILAAVTTADALKVMGEAMVNQVVQAINAQNRANCTSWAALAQAAGYITSAEQSAIGAILTATRDDPGWSATVAAPCDLAANFVDGQGTAPARLELARKADGSPLAVSGIAFINSALGR